MAYVGSVLQLIVRDSLVRESDKLEGFRHCFYVFAGCSLVALALTCLVKYSMPEENAGEEHKYREGLKEDKGKGVSD